MNMKYVASGKIGKKKKLDNRDTIRHLKLLLQNEMMKNKWVTLFNVHDVLKKVQEGHGGYLQTLQNIEGGRGAVFYLQFQRSEVDIVLSFDDEFNVTKVDILLWHDGNLKYDADYWMKGCRRWIFSCYKGKDKGVIPDFPTLVA